MNFRQIISISISLLLVSSQTLYAAGITVDTGAAKAHQAELIKAPSGLPIVNIVTPNAQGLSHNKFSNFNVEQQGLILNNSKTVANTELAGYISYNPNLTGNAAKLILSEVTGTSKTYLRGYTEVAGVAADVIIANPNGISVNGGGFINTPNVTLSTGTPMFYQGVLQGFDVSGGNIVIEGDGFNAHNVAKVNLYAKALELNAKLYADALHVTTGENTITLDGTVHSKEKTSTGLSLDSTLLGGIYANAIMLKSSDKGIGVHLPPEVLAQNSLELSANGEIVASKIIAGETTLKTDGANIKLKGDVTATTLSIDAGEKLIIEENNIIEASDALSILAESILNQGELSALEGKDKSTLRVTQSLENEGFIGGYDLDVSATHIENTGAIYSKNALSINAQTLNNDGLIRSNSTLDLLVSNTLTNQKEGVIYSDGTLTLAANSAQDKSESITNYGLIQSEKNIAIHAKTLNNLASAPTLKDLSSSTSKTISRGGKNDFDIVTTSIYKTVVEIPSSPAQIMADGSMLLDLGTLNNVYSLIASDEDIVLNATLANNIGVVLITKTKVVTTQYRDRKKCKKKHGVFKSCKHIAGYRGSFTKTENVEEPIANYGIQAKKSITGNVVTLNNLSTHAGLIGNAEIQAKLATIETIELNTKNLNALSNELTQNSEGTLDFIIDEESLDSLLEGVKTLEDLSTYQAELLATKSDIQEILDESKPLVSSLESLLPTLQTLDATANTAPITTTLETIKANFLSMETHLLALEELSSSLKAVDDAKLQKDALLLNQEALSTLINQNTTLLQALDLSALNTSLESKSDTLRSEVGVALAQQSNVEYKIINANNGLYQTNTHHALSSTQAPTYTTNNSTIIDNITLPKGKYGTFLVNKAHNHPYLIEANPRYTNYNTFISSDYMLSKLNFKPEQTQKRLGDAMYETQLVSNSIVRLSGSRYLEGYGTELAQFQGLMDNALSVQKDLGLELGISLSLEQIARLSKNIVWMVEKEVAGEKVLVPEVYLASSNVSSDGARIEAGEIHLLIEETLLNNGIIASEGSLKIATGASLTNQNGSITSGGTMALSSKGVLENLSGTIHSDGDMTLDAKSIHSTALSEEKTYTHARGYQKITEQGNAARFTSGGNLSMQTNDEISLVNSYIQATNDVTLTSKGTIALSALAKNESYDFKIGGGYNKGYATTHAPSSIEASNITLNASALTLNASNLTASDTLRLHATEGVAILASNDVRYQDTKVKTKGGLFGGKRVQQDTLYKESVVQSNLNANNILIQSNDASITLEAANLVAKENIVVDAKEDINVLTKQYREGEMHSVKKSSWGGLKQSASMNRVDALNAKEAELRTEALNIILKSGNDIKVIGSNIDAASDLQLQAANEVLIAAAQEFSQSEQWSKKSSLNLGNLITSLATLGFAKMGPVYEAEFKKDEKTNIYAKSSNINSGNNIIIDSGSAKVVGSNLSAEKNIQATTNTGSIEVLSAEERSQSKHEEKKTGVYLANILEVSRSLDPKLPSKDQDTKLKISLVSATHDTQKSSTDTLTHKSSSITSQDGDIVMDSKKDIVVDGSKLDAAKTMKLTTQEGDVTIKESIDTYQENAKEKHASAEISLTVQNEYVEIGSAVKAALESAEQLKKVKEDYSKYKNEVNKLESTLSDIKARYKAKEAGIDYEDIEDLNELIDTVKENEKYYVAAIAAAAADLASKSVAIAAQTATALASSGTWGFSAGLALDVKGEELVTEALQTKSLLSSVYGQDIIINTNTAKESTTTISGSNVVAENELSITTHDLHVKASTDTTTSKQDSKDLSGTLSMTMYGGGSGLGATLGYGEGHQSSDSTTNTNSNLIAKNITIETTNDASFKGATVSADDTLNVKVGGDLSVESQRDSSSSNSKGFNVSVSGSLGGDKDYTSNSKAQQNALNQTVGARTGDGLGSTGASYGASTGTTQSKQTVLTSLTGENVTIDVENNTHVKGALIAAGATNEQDQFEDNGKLNLSTGTLTFANSTNSQYSSSNSYNVGTNIGYTTGKNTQTNVEETTGKVNSSTLSLSNEMGYSRSKTLATVGEGTLHVKDTENSDELERLNRDTSKVNKELYSGSVGTSVTATLDHRLLTEDGRKQIKQEYEDMNKNMNIIAGTLPNANSENPVEATVEATVGEVWNKLTKYLSLGLVPSNENRGGILAEIPILTGTNDSAHMGLQVINQLSDKFNESDYVKMEESNYYKSLSTEDKAFFDGKELYVSKVPVEITSQSATYQNTINGMMNSEGEAIKNGLQQTGQSGTGTPVELTVAYNPTYGILPDLLEAFVDKSGIGTTGIAKQTGQFVNEVSTARGSEGSNFAMHSQANAIVYNGIAYAQTTTGFKPVGYFKANENVPTFVSFGSPMKGEDMRKVIEGSLGYTYSGSYTRPNDFVGEVLGGNSGNNEQADLAQKANILNAYKLFTADSPHSTYVCENYADQGVQCGYRK